MPLSAIHQLYRIILTPCYKLFVTCIQITQHWIGNNISVLKVDYFSPIMSSNDLVYYLICNVWMRTSALSLCCWTYIIHMCHQDSMYYALCIKFKIRTRRSSWSTGITNLPLTLLLLLNLHHPLSCFFISWCSSFLVFYVGLNLSLFCVMCPCLWIVHSWLFLRVSLSVIYNDTVWGLTFCLHVENIYFHDLYFSITGEDCAHKS